MRKVEAEQDQEVNQHMMNSELEKTIRELKTAKKKTGQPIWGALAEELEKPKRIRVDVNLSSINRFTKEGEIAAVPGKVLATGSTRPGWDTTIKLWNPRKESSFTGRLEPVRRSS